MSLKSTLMTPFTVVGTGTRHLLDVEVGLGQASSRYNARDQYRTSYSAPQRLGAGLGTAAAVAIPVAAAGTWLSKGMRVPGMAPGLQATVARGAGVAALAGMATIGAFKLKDIVEDDGHLGSIGAAAGLGIGGMIGYRFGGAYAPLVGAGLAIAGGVGGYIGGSKVSVGPGHIGEHIANTTQLHDSLPGTAVDYSRGFFNHFTESGPTSQGFSIGSGWGMRKSFAEDYNNTERAGGMAGDLAAAAILGGGALAVGRRVMGNGAAVASHAAELGALGRIGEKVNVGTHFANAIQGTAGMKGANVMFGAMALGLTAFAAKHEYDAWSDNGTNKAAGLAGAAATIGATALAGALVSKTGFIKALSPAAQPMASALTGAVLIGALSAARWPVQQFINDARDTWKANEGQPLDKVKLGVAGGAGAVAGGYLGFKVGSNFGAGLSGVGKVGAMVIGTAVGAGVGGAALGAMSPTMPSIGKVGIAGGVGAAALGGLTFAFTRNAKSAAMAAAAGGVMGIGASSLLGNTDSKKPAPTPVTIPATMV